MYRATKEASRSLRANSRALQQIRVAERAEAVLAILELRFTLAMASTG
jgi:hypothetical protein